MFVLTHRGSCCRVLPPIIVLQLTNMSRDRLNDLQNDLSISLSNVTRYCSLSQYHLWRVVFHIWMLNEKLHSHSWKICSSKVKVMIKVFDAPVCSAEKQCVQCIVFVLPHIPLHYSAHYWKSCRSQWLTLNHCSRQSSDAGLCAAVCCTPAMLVIVEPVPVRLSWPSLYRYSTAMMQFKCL